MAIKKRRGSVGAVTVQHKGRSSRKPTSTKRKGVSQDAADTMDAAVADLKNYLTQAMNENTLPEMQRYARDIEIHPSSFPYCALKTGYDLLQRNYDPVKHSDFPMNYFTTIGTVVHTLIQNFMGVGGRVWGHWICSNKHYGCPYTKLDEISPYHECPICGGTLAYEEIGYNEGNGVLVGHQDCLFEDVNGHFWIVDYKTTMLKKSLNHQRDRETLAGNITYHSQQTSYVVLCRRKYGHLGIKPRGYMLVFLPRDNPFMFQIVPYLMSMKEIKEKDAIIDRDMVLHTQLLNAKTYIDIVPLIEAKPCTSRKHYDSTMRSDFGECPLLDVCFKPKLLRKTLKAEFDDSAFLPLRKHLYAAEKAVTQEKNRIRELVKNYERNNK